MDLNFVDWSNFSRKECETKIAELLGQDKPVSIAINGEWGVGKTYFWKNELTPSIRKKFNKYPIYTSVFGKKDEQEIIQDLVVQFLKMENERTGKIKKIFNSLTSLVSKFYGINISINTNFIFEMFEAKDLCNAIVCIDDFERLSNKIPLEDILGLIAELKENKSCSVIVLYNENQLFEETSSSTKEKSKSQLEADCKNMNEKQKIFEKYKEKVFDYHIKFAPSNIEQFASFCKDRLELDTNFDSYVFMSDILNLKHLFSQHSRTNLRDLDRVLYTYELLLENLGLDEYPSKEFEKIYHYILFAITYAYHFKIENYYFEPRSGYGISNLLSPHTHMYSELLKDFLSELRYGLEFVQKTSFFTMPSFHKADNGIATLRCFLKNFTSKIISDTKFHREYEGEFAEAKNDNKKASINFFLKHKKNEAIPYMFGFRILNYAFKEERKILNEKIKSFAIEVILEHHKDELLNLFNNWCDEAYKKINADETNEYFWINKFRFYEPLKYTFNDKLKIDLPQNNLLIFFSE